MASNMGKGKSVPLHPETAAPESLPPRKRRQARPAQQNRSIRKPRAARGLVPRPSQSKKAQTLRLEFRTADRPHFSVTRQRKLQELRLCEKHWETRDQLFRTVTGEELMEKASTGQWYPAMLPEFKGLPLHVATFLGWCNLVMGLFGKPGLWISHREIGQMFGISRGTSKRMLAFLITGEHEGKISEVKDPKGWLTVRPDFARTMRAKDKQTGRKLAHWQQANCLQPGPLLLAVWQARKDRLAKKRPVEVGLVGQPAPLFPTNDPPSLCDSIEKRSTSQVSPSEVRDPTASGALFEGKKESPAAIVEKGPAEPAKLGAGFAGKAACQETPSVPPRASGARFVPSRPVAAALLEAIQAAVATGAPEPYLLELAQSDPELAMGVACALTGRSPPATTGGDSTRDVRHDRRSVSYRSHPSQRGRP